MADGRGAVEWFSPVVPAAPTKEFIPRPTASELLRDPQR
jgi:hypothetical protein